jgi:class 3 adenylate cyclase
MQAVHRASHGLVANEVIAVSENEVLRFLGSMREPADLRKVGSAFRTILFTDIAGSTALLNDLGETVWMEVLAEHDLILRRAVVKDRGREVKYTGDGIMASFALASRALRCAIAIHAGFDTRRASGVTPDLRVRVGLAAGEPVDHNDDMFGATVNLASRICDAAEPGHTLVSDAVRDLGLERGFSFGPRQERAFKGFSGSTAVYELLAPPPARRRRRAAPGRGSRSATSPG